MGKSKGLLNAWVGPTHDFVYQAHAAVYAAAEGCPGHAQGPLNGLTLKLGTHGGLSVRATWGNQSVDFTLPARVQPDPITGAVVAIAPTSRETALEKELQARTAEVNELREQLAQLLGEDEDDETASGDSAGSDSEG